MALNSVNQPGSGLLFAQVKANRAIEEIDADLCRVRIQASGQSAKAIAIRLEGRERCRCDAAAQTGLPASIGTHCLDVRMRRGDGICRAVFLLDPEGKKSRTGERCGDDGDHGFAHG